MGIEKEKKSFFFHEKFDIIITKLHTHTHKHACIEWIDNSSATNFFPCCHGICCCSHDDVDGFLCMNQMDKQTNSQKSTDQFVEPYGIVGIFFQIFNSLENNRIVQNFSLFFFKILDIGYFFFVVKRFLRHFVHSFHPFIGWMDGCFLLLLFFVVVIHLETLSVFISALSLWKTKWSISF